MLELQIITRDIKNQVELLGRHPSVLREFLKSSMYNTRGNYILKVNIPKLREYLTRRLGKVYEGINELAVKACLEGNGYIIIAYGSDGSNSSWILAIDPRDPRQVKSVREMCMSERLLRNIALEVIEDPAGWVRRVNNDANLTEEEKRAKIEMMKVVKSIIEPCLGEENRQLEPCLARASLMILLDGYMIASLINMKMRILRDPCTLVT